MIQLKSADDDFDVEKIRTSGATSQRSHLPVAGEVAANEMRITDCGVDTLSQLIPCANIEIVADEVPALAGHVAVKTWVTPRTGVTVEQVIKSVRAACKPIPAVATVDTQVLDRLELELQFWRLDILEHDVIVR